MKIRMGRKEQLSTATRLSRDSAKHLQKEGFSKKIKIIRVGLRLLLVLLPHFWEGLDLLKSLLVSIFMTPQYLINEQNQITEGKISNQPTIKNLSLPGSLPGTFLQRTLLYQIMLFSIFKGWQGKHSHVAFAIDLKLRASPSRIRNITPIYENKSPSSITLNPMMKNDATLFKGKNLFKTYKHVKQQNQKIQKQKVISINHSCHLRCPGNKVEKQSKLNSPWFQKKSF